MIAWNVVGYGYVDEIMGGGSWEEKKNPRGLGLCWDVGNLFYRAVLKLIFLYGTCNILFLLCCSAFWAF